MAADVIDHIAVALESNEIVAAAGHNRHVIGGVVNGVVEVTGIDRNARDVICDRRGSVIF